MEHVHRNSTEFLQLKRLGLQYRACEFTRVWRLFFGSNGGVQVCAGHAGAWLVSLVSSLPMVYFGPWWFWSLVYMMLCILGHCGVLDLRLCRCGGWLVVPLRGRRTILDDVAAVE